MVPRLRIGDMTALWVWDGQFDIADPEAQNVWEELWPEAAEKPMEETVRRLASHVGVGLEDGWTSPRDTRFSKWSRLFCAAVNCLPLLETSQSWVVRTFFHGGWGTYYLEYHPLDGNVSFAISEEGHIAHPDLDAQMSRTVKSFTIRPAIESGMPREALESLLLPALQVCVDAAERKGEGRN